MSDHTGTMMNTSVEQILEQLAACPVRARNTTEVPAITGHAHYQGRHRVADDAPLYARAARSIAAALRKPGDLAASLGERLGHKLADSLGDDSADRVYDLVTGETFREAARTISTTWRAMDRAAYGRIPKTWRHRLEARHRAQKILDDSIQTTELWWAGRQSDYAPALGLHTPTQPLKVIEEKTSA